MTNQETHIWNNLICIHKKEFGFAARRNRGSYTGDKVHMVISEYAIGIVEGSTIEPNTFAHRFTVNGGKPVLVCCYPACGCTQGQNAAKPSDTRTAEDVTCKKCLSKMHF